MIINVNWLKKHTNADTSARNIIAFVGMQPREILLEKETL